MQDTVQPRWQFPYDNSGTGPFFAEKDSMKKAARGRPLKYGRPARLVAITLPEDTISDDRAFLALADGSRLPDLELAILDRLSDHGVTGRQREGLEALRHALMDCRRAEDVEVEPRSIFVVEKSPRPR